jgi:hypothetical protein
MREAARADAFASAAARAIGEGATHDDAQRATSC